MKVRTSALVSPRRPAGQRLASSSEDDVAGDDGEHSPHGQKPPPVQFDGEVQRNHPHLDKSHQLRRRTTLYYTYLPSYFVVTDSPAALAWPDFPSCSWHFLIDCTHCKTFYGRLVKNLRTISHMLVHQSWLQLLRHWQRGALSHLSEQRRRCRQIYVTVWRLYI